MFKYGQKASNNLQNPSKASKSSKHLQKPLKACKSL